MRTTPSSRGVSDSRMLSVSAKFDGWQRHPDSGGRLIALLYKKKRRSEAKVRV